MHFIITWLCAVRRGKGTGHPTPFNSWLSTPRSGGMGCAVRGHVCMQVYACTCVCMYAHLVPALYEDPTSLRADNYTYIHTYIHTYTHGRRIYLCSFRSQGNKTEKLSSRTKIACLITSHCPFFGTPPTFVPLLSLSLSLHTHTHTHTHNT
jgi:hypothetical protein